ncbi:hypothetical protein H9Q72_001634 [Fusarium xylarioides]|uniref:NACHT domain-containing protein n=1 Tax=Fusarium xylarioides TaxID=221167 RepID=A0A9P7IA70_9HYPO|nr:hypothetical protein H9Q72_001634 [Fusarium xylarioides]
MSSGDLWSKAIADLGDKLPPDNFKHPENKTLQDLLENTKLSRERLVNKSWSFKRKKGEVVYVRDLLAKASKWIKHFMSVVDISVQCDPIHAGLPWAGVRFLLIVATGDLETYQSLLDQTVDIMEIICRNAIVESFLDDVQSQAGEKLRDGLVKLYTSILTYLAKANSYYKQDRFKSFFKNGLLASSEFESAFEDIEKAQADIDRAVDFLSLQEQLHTNSQLKQMIETFNAPVNRWDETLHAITDHRKEEDRRETLRWISDIKYEQHHEQANSEVLRGTGQWLLQDALFVRWKSECASSILWLYGIPGSGKSKLASIVIEDAIEAFQQKQAPHPAYFYCSCNTAEPERSDPTRILASIARQLSTPQRGGPILEPAIKEYEKQKKSDFMSGPLRLEKSKALVLDLLQKYNSATIVLDALDEINPKTRETLLEILEDLLNESPCLLKLFVTSREHRDITYKLNKYPNLHLSSERNTADINLYIESETTRLIKKGCLLRDSNRKGELCRLIIDTLKLKAQGMFRLASLQLNDLRGQGTDRAIEERLPQLPRTLEETYNEILDKIQNMVTIADRQYARNALSLLLCARKQLKSEEFLTLVSTTEGGSPYPISHGQLLQICPEFVMFDSGVDTFRFSHLTVREFLEVQEFYGSTSSNAVAAEACLSMLFERATQTSIETLFEYPYLFWAEHARAASPERSSRLGELLRRFLGDEKTGSSFYRWHTTVEEILEPIDSFQLLDYDARLRLNSALAYVPRVLLTVSAYDLFGTLSPEQWTELAHKPSKNREGKSHHEVILRYGNSESLEWLYQNDSSFEVTEKSIEAAARNSVHGKEIVAFLLANRTRTDIQITNGMVRAAASNRNSGEDIMALLLENDAIKIIITEEITDAIAENFGRTTFQQLCDRAAGGISIGEGAFIAAAENRQYSEEITAMLLEQSEGEIIVPETTISIMAAAVRGKEILELLFGHPRVRILVTEDVLKTGAKDRFMNEEAWTYLLKKRGPEVLMNEDIVKYAATNPRMGNKLIKRLLDECGPIIPTTPAVVNAIVGHLDKPTIELYLNMTGAIMRITKALIDKAAENPFNQMDELALLLERGIIEDEKIEELMPSIVRGCSVTTFQEFLHRTGTQIQINEQIVEGAAQHKFYQVEMLALLLERQGGGIPITDLVIESALRHDGDHPETLDLLVEKSADTIPMTTRSITMIARLGSVSAFQKLMDQRASDVPFAGEVIEAISFASRNREERYRILFEKGIVTTGAVSEVTKSALSHMGPSILKQFIDQNEIDIEITEENVLAAAKNWGNQSDVMKLMLERRDRSVPISERTIIAIANYFEVVILQQIFDEGDTNIRISQELLQAAAANYPYGEEVVSFLLDKQVEDLPVTEEIVEAAANNWLTGKDVLALLLERQDGMIPVTDKSLYTMIGNWNGIGMLMLVLERCRPKISVTEQVIEEAARNSTEALETLLERRGKDFEMTERIVNAIAGKGWLDKRRLAVLLDKCGPEIHITEHTVERILRNKYESVEILALFLQRGISIPVTEEILAQARESIYSPALVMQFSHFADMQDDALNLVGEGKQQEETNGSDAQRDPIIELRGYWTYFCLFSLFVILLSHYLVTL